MGRKKKIKICGIYKIENLINGKVYIGSSVDIAERWHRHSTDLRTNRHGNEYLQNAWNKYGENNFKFEIIEYIDDINILINREQYWIDQLNTCKRSVGYNLSPTAGSPYGFKHTDETKLKQSKLQAKNRKPILQIDLYGNIVKEWTCVSQIGRETNFKERAIKDVALGLRGYIAYDYIWIYTKDYDSNTFDLQAYLNNKHQSKKVIQFSLDGTIITYYDNLTDVIQKNQDFTISALSNTCNKYASHKSYKGYLWMFEIDYLNNGIEKYNGKYYSREPRKIVELDNQLNIIKIWENISIAARNKNVGVSTISSCLKGISQTSCGSKWMYFEEYQKLNLLINKIK